jgi:aspartate aminotransferase
MIAEFARRRGLVMDLLSEIPGVECNAPQGAFYVFPRYNRDIPSAKLAEILLREGHVAVTPGTAFGPHGEGFFRISYAASEADLREGIARIKKFMGAL